jgi:hypothetical protein
MATGIALIALVAVGGLALVAVVLAVVMLWGRRGPDDD